MYSRVNSNLLEDRLDAEFYSLEQIKNHKTLQDYGVIPLSAYCNGINVGYTGELTSVYRDQGTTLYRVSDINGIFLSNDDVNYVPDDFAANNSQIWIRDNDIVFAAVGNTIGKVALKTVSMPDGVCSRALMIARPLTNKIDSSFLIAYLATKYAQKSLLRGISGSAQPVLNTPLIANLPVITAESLSQKYIGDKVRQAEQLGAWAKRLEQVSSFMFANALAELGYKQKKSTKIVRTKLEDRLDPAFYDEKFSFFDESWFKINSEPLKQFIESGSYGVLPSSNSYGKGNVRFIRATDLKNANIDPTCFTYVPEEEVADKAKVSKGDILMEIKGAISTCELAESHLAGTYINGSIFRFTPKGINNAYLAYFLSSTIKELYCERVSVNNIISYLDLASLHELPVIRLKNDIEEFLAKNLININLAKKIAFALTRSAKTLVESLIEGQLTEQQLIQAQQALEDGDNSLDQAIISKLSAEGYAIEGATPLFSDVDELYSLLEDAAQAEAEE
ncbi:TPA: restriction endonuclease subunit S [Klebsiella pneumoniae]|uniref:restriction endonuclease subunit S n=1 Tax=Klebsiella pneumoniae TaxID=573 RepID=UPI0002924D37|nr:restriction endonuclease subunit S [Klebsiella pneumoniae]UTW35542.1 restriction endonuclease subunit S [Klebsiella pneumoniae subsp. pneumoniae Ecl8]CCN27810.1 restriction modification system DNA specificity domain protein [Klebsiella pneumoniae subsp. pneumoniae Ecl8]HBX4021328.1 restriction endonuclease subunit S [Klebsiella pneumoniae]HBX4026525.1 restriction endonuclease subunit S [Klebsiella pneumoniae]HBX4032108.1 restriction endonuclease subunit S [Klebsiella pneumoniae]